MNFILFDDHLSDNLLPFTYTRPVASLRVGILTIKEKWQYLVGENSQLSYLTKNYLQECFPSVLTSDNIYINAALFPSIDLVNAIKKLETGQGLVFGDRMIAARSDNFNLDNHSSIEFSELHVP